MVLPAHAPSGAGTALSQLFQNHAAGHRVGSGEKRRVLRDLSRCRTSALGGHRYACRSCGSEIVLYNSCRNRHCPTCQSDQQRRWIRSRQEKTLPVPYFHVVFTLPSELRGVALAEPRVVYDLLFKAARDVLHAQSEERLQCKLAITMVLHTWTRELLYHPHVHALVSGGGLSLDGTRWIPAREGYLFPFRILHRLFRGRLLHLLIEARDKGEIDPALLWDPIQKLKKQRGSYKHWVVYVDPPRGRDPKALLSYLGRYLYRVAISEHRVVTVTDTTITFRTRGSETATLPIGQFLDRFLLHVLPSGFRKVRHYGLSAPGNAHLFAKAAALLSPKETVDPARAQEPEQQSAATDSDTDAESIGSTRRCPYCGARAIVLVGIVEPGHVAWHDTS